jgi:hypothetical protein
MRILVGVREDTIYSSCCLMVVPSGRELVEKPSHISVLVHDHFLVGFNCTSSKTVVWSAVGLVKEVIRRVVL